MGLGYRDGMREKELTRCLIPVRISPSMVNEFQSHLHELNHGDLYSSLAPISVKIVKP
jgi:hypothetical protein